MPSATAIPTATNPTERETKPPSSIRAKTSRPSSSVPSRYRPSRGRCAAATASMFGRAIGGLSRSGRRTSRGSRTGWAPLVRTRPTRATAKNASTVAMPATAARFRQNARQASCAGERGGSAAATATIAPDGLPAPACAFTLPSSPGGGRATPFGRALSQPDPRVDHHVEEVGEEGADQGEAGGEEVDGDDHRVVAAQDRLVAESPDPWPGEDRLEDDAPADERGNEQAQHRHEGQEPVPERVVVENVVLLQPFGAGRAD